MAIPNIFASFSEDWKKRNYSLYGQWIGFLTIILCIALGIANIFHFNVVIVFAIICIVQGLVILFVELPTLLKICPLTDRFVGFIHNFDENWPRCGFYLLNAAIQYLSLVCQATSLLVIAIMCTFSSICYAIAALKHQEYLKTDFSNTQQAAASAIGEHVVRNAL